MDIIPIGTRVEIRDDNFPFPENLTGKVASLPFPCEVDGKMIWQIVVDLDRQHRGRMVEKEVYISALVTHAPFVHPIAA